MMACRLRCEVQILSLPVRAIFWGYRPTSTLDESLKNWGSISALGDLFIKAEIKHCYWARFSSSRLAASAVRLMGSCKMTGVGIVLFFATFWGVEENNLFDGAETRPTYCMWESIYQLGPLLINLWMILSHTKHSVDDVCVRNEQWIVWCHFFNITYIL